MPNQPQEIEFIARGVLIERGQVLLCRDVKHGYHSLPGGHVDPGESAAEAVAREYAEETGLVVSVTRCALVHEHRFSQKGRPRHELNVVFLVERSGGGGGSVPSLEPRLAFDWAAVTALAALDVRPASLKEWLPDMLASREVLWKSSTSA